jgi:hypothetical protein
MIIRDTQLYQYAWEWEDDLLLFYRLAPVDVTIVWSWLYYWGA